MIVAEPAEASRLGMSPSDQAPDGSRTGIPSSPLVLPGGGSGFVVDIVGRGATVDHVGSKAASLDRLVRHGFPVPRTLAVTAEAYRGFVEHAGLKPTLTSLATAEPSPPDRIERAADQIDGLFLKAPMSEQLDTELRTAVQGLLADGPIAVRSSASAEDLVSASFAGQYRTALNLETEDDALDAIRLCWASLWRPAARVYRRMMGIPEEDLAMGVALQAMVLASHAGVVFSRDPLGDSGAARVEVVEGLGEALVSGEVTPDDYRVDRATLEVRGDQEMGAPDFLENLVRICLRVERRMGMPQDVEWAYDGETVVLLQTRPITRRTSRRPDDDGFDTEPRGGHTYTPLGVGEMLPGTLPPLLWSINGPMLSDAFCRLFSDLGIDTQDWRHSPVVARFRGRAVLDLSILRDAAASLPGGSAAEVERQFLGRSLTSEAAVGRNGSLRQLLAGLKAARLRNRVEDEVELFVDAASFVPVLRVNIHELSTRRLLAYQSRIRDLAWRGYHAEVAASAGAAASYRGLEIALERWIGSRSAALWAQRVTSVRAAGDQPGVTLTGELWDAYIESVCDRSTCDCLFGEKLENAAPEATAANDGGLEFLEDLYRMMRHFGSMAVYAGPTWDEASSAACECDDPMACCRDGFHRQSNAERETREQALAALMSCLRSSWKWRLTRILTGQLVDMRRRVLRKLIADATRYLSLRERSKSALLILGGEERRLILEAARRLWASGALSTDADVLLLSDDELKKMLLGGEPVSAREIEFRRAAYIRAEEGEPLPETFEGQPGSGEDASVGEDRLTGRATSPGVYRGTVRVLSSVASGSKLEPGEIIVAPRTDPSWTPLFAIAGGIVLEEGGPLSHAAIVARELGIPAVLSVKGATQTLGDGDLIVINGTEGEVTRIEAERMVAG